MASRFLVRLDDASPFMDKGKWERIEEILDRYNIKPIVAIIPDNKDKEVSFADSDSDFWNKAVKWQEKGWGIALHGYDHQFITNEKGLIPRNAYSEFAGVPYDIQEDKIKKGLEIFKNHDLTPEFWVAPAHSFDLNTLKILKSNSDIEIVSDGFTLGTYKKYGFKWIPQQVSFIPNRPFGLWTVCLHPNKMSDKQFERFETRVKAYANNFIDFRDLKFKRFKNLPDVLFSLYMKYKSRK